MSGTLTGKRVLVTAGGTREPLDAVRYIGNRSSGRMGVALAAEARRRGADVTLIASNLAVPPPADVEVVQAPTAADVEREASARADADVVIMAAAISDYRPAETEAAKRPKDDSTWLIELEPTTDVLRQIAEHRLDEDGAAGKARDPSKRQRKRSRGPVLIGFAAETGGGGLDRARKKLASKQVDLIVYNDVSREDVGFDADDNEVVIVSGGGERRVDKAPKDEIAAAILDEVERLT